MYKRQVEEVKGSDATVTYDTMKANVTVTVKHDGTAKVLIATVGDIADKEFNNRVTPPEEPKFQPEKYVLNAEKFSITDNKLLDDDSELADKYSDTNANPYADGTANNEAENINTKTVNRGDKLVYQVWLDTTKFDAANKDNIQFEQETNTDRRRQGADRQNSLRIPPSGLRLPLRAESAARHQTLHL